MYCRKCGTENDDNAYRCVQCGEIVQESEGVIVQETEGVTVQETIPNYLAQSILVTLLCCMPLGIPAIVFAAQVNGKVLAGDVEGARKASRNARTWCWWSFGVCLVGSAAYFLLIILVGLAEAM